jgi:hypothetical protein
MKKMLLLMSLILPIIGYSQKIPTRANAIIITPVSKNYLKSILTKGGFTVVDHDSLSFETLPRQYRSMENGNLIIKASPLDSGYRLIGLFNQIAYESLVTPGGNKWRIAVRTSLESNSRTAFEIIRKMAESTGAKVECIKLRKEDLPYSSIAQ